MFCYLCNRSISVAADDELYDWNFIFESAVFQHGWMDQYNAYRIVIIDWSGHESKDELKALAFCANVANFTICSTDASDTLSLLKTIPADKLMTKRNNTGPLCLFSTPDDTEEAEEVVATYFNGCIATIEETILRLTCRRILLECRDLARDQNHCYKNSVRLLACKMFE